MDLELEGKVAIVTGGSRGIGKAIGRVLAGEGVKVALVARTQSSLDAAAADVMRQAPGRAKGFVCDTTDDAGVKKMVADVIAAFGRVDILVNCAAKPSGQARPPTLDEITAEEVWDHVNTKVVGYLRTAQAVMPHMIKQKSGRIINVSGLGARHTGTTVGSIRNVGVAALTKNMADELAPHGIQAICVHPGLIRTEATPGVIAAQRQDRRRQRGRDREAHGRRQPREEADHRRSDRLRGRVPRLAEGDGHQRRLHPRRRRHARIDLLLSNRTR